MKTILILAPHQDDEILSCTYLIKKELLQNNNIIIGFITNGDYKGKKFTDIRAKESLESLTELGVKRENVFFFGYGDGTLYDLFYSEDDEKIPSKCSIQTYSCREFKTFHYLLTSSEVPYVKSALKDDLIKFLNIILPSVIYCPSIYDMHNDHKGTNLFLKEAIQSLRKSNGYNPEVYTYLIHAVRSDFFWPNRFGKFYNIPKNMNDDFWNKRIKIKNNDFKLKKALISNFSSQKPRANYYFLYSFAKGEEIFWKEDF